MHRLFSFLAYTLVHALALAFLGMPTSAQARLIDLSNGAGFPSNNSALFENPAALGAYKTRSFDLGLFFQRGQEPGTGTASYVDSSGALGFGFGTWKRSTDNDSVSLGFGIKLLDLFALGLATTFEIGNSRTYLDIGTRFELTDGVTFALVAHRLRAWPEKWVLAFAGGSNSVRFELDLRFYNQTFSPFDPHTADALPGLSIKPTDWLTVRFGLPIRFFPNIDTNFNQPEIGAAFRISEQFALYGILNHNQGIQYTIGLRAN